MKSIQITWKGLEVCVLVTVRGRRSSAWYDFENHSLACNIFLKELSNDLTCSWWYPIILSYISQHSIYFSIKLGIMDGVNH